MRSFSICILVISCSLFAGNTMGQEHVGPLMFNPVVHSASMQHSVTPLYRKTALSLPFFEDFTNRDIFPDQSKWVDKEAYINNTMCVDPISQGVATLDALDQNGFPYDSSDNGAIINCDSLTSQPIDIGSYLPSDSLYLSFFYQPQGNGFYPGTDDTLMLLMRKSNKSWQVVWRVGGSMLQPFQQVMIPITDTSFFNNSFQFRFIDREAFNYSGPSWNIDYVRLNAYRNMYDTAVNDVAYTTDPTFMLNDYTYMPYRQFLAASSSELASQMSDTIRNNNTTSASVSYGYTATETTTATSLSTGGPVSASIGGGLKQEASFPTYTATIPSPGPYDKVVFENKFYMQTPTGDNKNNDTITRDQVFDNYLAYDDGTAESSYYLTLYASAPGQIAIEYHLNQADTMRGMAIYFNKQIPLASSKFLNPVVYKTLQGVDGALEDDTLYFDNDILSPGYMDTINHFWYYKFKDPVPLSAGTFYAAVFLPAFSGSDSMYFGLDRNRIGGNHAYFNVSGVWTSSAVQGAIMIRPVLGQPIKGSAVTDIDKADDKWSIYPNPAQNDLYVNVPTNKSVTFAIMDIQGRNILSGSMGNDHKINISALKKGMYFVRISTNGATGTKKFIKE